MEFESQASNHTIPVRIYEPLTRLTMIHWLDFILIDHPYWTNSVSETNIDSATNVIGFRNCLTQQSHSREVELKGSDRVDFWGPCEAHGAKVVHFERVMIGDGLYSRLPRLLGSLKRRENISFTNHIYIYIYIHICYPPWKVYHLSCLWSHLMYSMSIESFWGGTIYTYICIHKFKYKYININVNIYIYIYVYIFICIVYDLVYI